MRKATCNTSQGRVKEKVVVSGTEASNAVEERPGQRETGGGNFVAALKKGRFSTLKKWRRSGWEKEGRGVEGEGWV